MLIVIYLLILCLAYLFNKFYLQPMKVRKYYLTTLKKLGYRVYQLPFKPFGAPIYESLAYYFSTKNKRKMRSMEGYDVVLGNILNLSNLIFVNHKLAQQISRADKLAIFPKVQYPLRLLKYSFGQGLIFLEGDQWKNRRKILSKAFNFDFLKALVPLISNFFNDCYTHIENSPQNKGKSQLQLQLFPIGNKLFAMVVIGGFIGMNSLNEKIDGMEIHDLALQAAYLATQISRDPLTLVLGVKFYKLGLLEKHRKLEQKLRLLKGFISNKLEIFRKQFQEMSQEDKKQSKNLVHLLLHQAQLENQTLTDSTILDEILVFMIAGTETTATLFTTYVLEIFKHKQVEKKVREEIKQYIKNQADFNFDNLKNLKYLDWVQLETLRLTSGGEGLLDRIATTDTNIADIPIVKDTTLNYFLRTNLYDDSIFQKAKQFRPERWADASPELLNMVMMGFSLGPRTCIGKQLALLESKIAVIKFMQRYENVKQMYQREFIFTFAYHLKNSTIKFNIVKQE